MMSLNKAEQKFADIDDFMNIEPLGEGGFGRVIKGAKKKGLQEKVVIRAIPIPKKLPADMKIAFDFMLKCNHPNFVWLLGTFAENFNATFDTRFLVFQYMENGSLYNFVKENKVDKRFVAKMAFDVCNGMEYLHKGNHLHKNLCAKSIFVDTGAIVKISDYLLNELINPVAGDDYFFNEKYPDVPPLRVRWLPPECLPNRTRASPEWSRSSDVWSFGVLLWETLANGRVPYGAHPIPKVMNLLFQGGNPLKELKPQNAPKEFIETIARIFVSHPKQRPQFTELKESFEKLFAKFIGDKKGSIMTFPSSAQKGQILTNDPKKSEIDFPSLPTVVPGASYASQVKAGNQKAEALKVANTKQQAQSPVPPFATNTEYYSQKPGDISVKPPPLMSVGVNGSYATTPNENPQRSFTPTPTPLMHPSNIQVQNINLNIPSNLMMGSNLKNGVSEENIHGLVGSQTSQVNNGDQMQRILQQQLQQQMHQQQQQLHYQQQQYLQQQHMYMQAQLQLRLQAQAQAQAQQEYSNARKQTSPLMPDPMMFSGLNSIGGQMYGSQTYRPYGYDPSMPMTNGYSNSYGLSTTEREKYLESKIQCLEMRILRLEKEYDRRNKEELGEMKSMQTNMNFINIGNGDERYQNQMFFPIQQIPSPVDMKEMETVSSSVLPPPGFGQGPTGPKEDTFEHVLKTICLKGQERLDSVEKEKVNNNNLDSFPFLPPRMDRFQALQEATAWNDMDLKSECKSDSPTLSDTAVPLPVTVPKKKKSKDKKKSSEEPVIPVPEMKPFEMPKEIPRQMPLKNIALSSIPCFPQQNPLKIFKTEEVKRQELKNIVPVPEPKKEEKAQVKEVPKVNNDIVTITEQVDIEVNLEEMVWND